MLKFKRRKKGKKRKKKICCASLPYPQDAVCPGNFQDIGGYNANCTVHVDIPYTHRRRIELEDKAKVVA